MVSRANILRRLQSLESKSLDGQRVSWRQLMLAQRECRGYIELRRELAVLEDSHGSQLPETMQRRAELERESHELITAYCEANGYVDAMALMGRKAK